MNLYGRDVIIIIQALLYGRWRIGPDQDLTVRPTDPLGFSPSNIQPPHGQDDGS
jgi:hypothetical protein